MRKTLLATLAATILAISGLSSGPTHAFSQKQGNSYFSITFGNSPANCAHHRRQFGGLIDILAPCHIKKPHHRRHRRDEDRRGFSGHYDHSTLNWHDVRRAKRQVRRELRLRRAHFTGVSNVWTGGLKFVRYTLNFETRRRSIAVDVKQNRWNGRVRLISRAYRR